MPPDDVADFADFDLAALRKAVGTTTFDRGVDYASKGRVLKWAWDRAARQLDAHVVGRGAMYVTTVQLGGPPGRLKFDYCDCSCPVGGDCKHGVAAIVTLARPSSARAGADRAAPRARPTQVPLPTPASPFTQQADRPAPDPSWLRRIRELAPPAAPVSRTGRPLAIELSVPAAGPNVAKKLRARVMRQGKSKWVNDNLTWNIDRSWQLSAGGFRGDHVALIASIRQAAVDARQHQRTYVYSYYSSEYDRELNLATLEADNLWPLLDLAAELGVELIHTTPAWGPVERIDDGEVRFDVTGRDKRAVTPLLYLGEQPAPKALTPLAFVGPSGGAVVVGRAATAEQANRDQPLALVRLTRQVPMAVQRLLLGGESIDVPARDAGRFVTDAWPALAAIAPIVSSDRSFTPPQVSGPALLLRASFGADHRLDLTWGWRYDVDDRTVEFAAATMPSVGDLRDAPAEAAQVAALRRDVPEADAGHDRRLDGHATMRFVTDILPRLLERDDLAVITSGDRASYRDVGPSLTIGISTDEVEGSTDWFDLGVTITAEEREIPFAAVFIALAEGLTHLLLPDGSYFSLDRPELGALHRLIEEARALQDAPRDGLRLSRFQADLWDELQSLGVVTRQAESWQRQVSALTRFGMEAGDGAETTLPRLEAELRPYQLDGFRWLAMLWRHRLGGILADDMGLGKTLQTLALIAHAREEDPSCAPFLVIAPTSVVSNWVTEAQRFAPQLDVIAITESAKRRDATIRTSVAPEAHVVVTSYTLFRLDAREYEEVSWAAVVLDEAQQVKNHQAKTYSLVRQLDVPFKLAITGTPMENNLTELWAILSIVAPGLFPSPTRFAEMYARPIERRGDSELLARLRRRIKPLVLRRTKEQVATDLPAKQEQVVYLDLAPKHRRVYDTHLQRERQRVLGLIGDFNRNRMAIFRSLTLLRQLSLHATLVDPKHARTACSKLDALSEEIDEVIAGGHRALVFSQFTRFLALARERLDDDGVVSVYLDGKTTKRADVIERFRSGDAPVFLISLKAGGVGLNLTEADYVYLLDPWWNPATEDQAIDRSHRIGQTRSVLVRRLIARDTIEEKVMALKERKQELFRGVMDEGDLFSTALTADDVRALLA